MTKDLKEKAINIKGKQYVQVADRILYFNETYPNGHISTELVKYEDKQIIVKAHVHPDSTIARIFTGYAQEIEGDGYINKTSALENAETSAVGRALAMMGIGVIDSIASIDEINKANNRPPQSDSKPQTQEKGMDVPLAVRNSNSVLELSVLWETLSEQEQDQYKDIITIRKKELT